MNILIFGLGYSVAHWARSGARPPGAICATFRNLEAARGIQHEIPGLEALPFDSQAVAEKIAKSDALLVSTPPVNGRDPVLALYRDAIAASGVSRIIYLSTIGVYGGQGGAWVDEDTPPAASSARGNSRVAAEQEWRDLAADRARRVFILRLAGIYGPGRNALQSLREGVAKRIVREGQVFNRIHVDDIAQAIAACLTTDRPSGVFNVSDDEPSPPQDVVTYGAKLLGIAPPVETPFDSADLSPMARSFWANNQRVSNRRLKADLGVSLRHPTYREGLRALLDEP